MNTLLCASLLFCSVVLSGCSRIKQVPDDLTPEKEPVEVNQIPEDSSAKPSGMIQIHNVTLADNTLTLDYRVSNPFQDDIRVCYDRTVYGNQDVQHAKTEINGETVWVILGDNIERRAGFPNPPPVAKYVRLAPGESCSGRILLHLPIRDYSPEPPRVRSSRKYRDIVLCSMVLLIEYLGPKSNKYFDSLSERRKMTGSEPEITVVGPFYYLSSSPTVKEEILDGKLREVIYANRSRTERQNEEFAQVVIADVAIPCSVVVDDRL